MTASAALEQNSASRRESLLVAAGLLSLVYGYFHFWHGPRNHEIAAIRQQVNDSKIKLESDLALIQTLQQTLERSHDSDAKSDAESLKLEHLRRMNSRFSFLINEISGKSGKNPFKIIKITTGTPESISDYTKVLLKVEIQAPFLAVGKFLEKLEQSDLLTEVVQVDVTRVDPELKRCTVKIELYSYAARSSVTTD